MKQDEPETPSVAFVLRQSLTFYPLQQTAAGLMWTFFWMYPLVPGILAKAFFDRLAGNSPGGLSLTAIVGFMVLAALARGAVVYLNVWLSETLGLRLLGLFQRNILARIFERPGARALPVSVGEAISTLRDDIGESMFLTGWLFDLVGWSIFVVGGIAIMLQIDWEVTLLVLGPLIGGIALMHAANRQVKAVREQSRTASARVAGSIVEISSAVQAIQIAGAEDQVIAQFRRQGRLRQQAMLRDRLIGLLMDAVMAGTATLGAGLTLLAASAKMSMGASGPGSFTVSDFALFSTYLMQVTGMAGFIGYLVSTYQQASVHIHRVFTLMQGAAPGRLVEHHPINVREPLAPLPIIQKGADDALETFEARGLTLLFAENGRGIEDISFSLRKGTLTAITGRIGSGKTTLVRACLGLLDAQSGELRWNGRVIACPADFMVPPRAGYTPQVPTLLSGTLRENILLGLPDDAGKISTAVFQAVLEHDLGTFPDGLETVIGTRGVRLSGGQVQRAAAARMFVREADLVVMDDLSSALDVETERLLWQRLFDRRQGTGRSNGFTCLVVTHRPAVLERANQILLLQDGKITARGTLAELIQTSAEMRNLMAY